jgi:acylphosphatase
VIRPQRIRCRVIVQGRVQGVFFRAECASTARAQGVSGWIGNQPDGTVYAEFEGARDAVEAMVDWCHTGPLRSTVTHVEVTPLEPTGETGFSVH